MSKPDDACLENAPRYSAVTTFEILKYKADQKRSIVLIPGFVWDSLLFPFPPLHSKNSKDSCRHADLNPDLPA